MKNCLYIPRVLVPGKERKNWSVIACDRYRNERSYWDNEVSSRGAVPSALNLILPEVCFGEDDEERIARIREETYAALEYDFLEKLARGFVLCERKSAQRTRRGIVAAIDLECYGLEGEDKQVRSVQRADGSAVKTYLALRKSSPLEMPHIIVLYSDPKDKTVGLILKEDNEEIYNYKIKGGEVRGYFLDELLSEEVSHRLQMHTETFFVAEGAACAEAAKRHWQEVKKGLTKGEMGRHPARFMLAEFVNVSDDAVELLPVHRLVRETDAEAFADYFLKEVGGKRKGRMIEPQLTFNAGNVEKIDGAIARFLKADGGKRVFIHDEEKLKKFAEDPNAFGVLLPRFKKAELLKQLEEGALFPEFSFSVGGEEGARYYIEAREISYD